ncbi:hypothetical protein Tco_0710584, partial [Tanacetum coccineum]
MRDENQPCNLGDYSRPSHEGYRNTIELREGDNVVPLRSDTIRLVQNGLPLDEIQVDATLNFVEEPVEILKREFKKLKRSRIAIVKVWWNSKRGLEFTWEREDQMKL